MRHRRETSAESLMSNSESRWKYRQNAADKLRSTYLSKLGEKPDFIIDLEGSNFSAVRESQTAAEVKRRQSKYIENMCSHMHKS